MMSSTFRLSLIALFFLAVVFSCNEDNLSANARAGQKLAREKCASCHQYPEPQLLDKKTWGYHVLPKMGAFLGFRHFGYGTYFEDESVQQAVPLTDWNKIVEFYVSSAPDSLEAEKQTSFPITIGLPHFDIEPVSAGIGNPATTFIAFSPASKRIFFADGSASKMYSLSPVGAIVDSITVEKGVSQARITDTGLYVLSMGLLHPSDEKLGKLNLYKITSTQVTILDSLQRPVHASYGYLNVDSLEDIVISEFGNNTGELAWFEQQRNGAFTKHVLRALPGAVKTQIADIDSDGKNEIVALMAQGNEGIFVYHLNDQGNFSEKMVLQFSPSHGSNYFELVDMNGDGSLDVLATNGDNADYPPILKPYHGVRVFLNDKKGKFREDLFLPLNGASKAIAIDFDDDGDKDIAAISYFPNYAGHPEESFVYFQNNGAAHWKAFSFSTAASGRWLTMDAADIDSDGDVDIILGNAKFTLGTVPPAVSKSWEKNALSILIIRNNRKK